MNQQKRQILKLEQDFRDTLENDLLKQQTSNKKIKVIDIKFVGQLSAENVFIVEKEIIELDENRNERMTNLTNYYLGDKCIAGKIGNSELIYSESFKETEPEKMKSVNELLEKTDEQDIENNSLSKLEKEEVTEVLEEDSKKDKNDLSEKQAEKIKINGIQKADLNKKVDGKETLGKRLDLEEYDSLYVVYSEKVSDITDNLKINNTTYSLIGMTKDGQARVLNDEFEMDKTVGNNGSREQTKIRANSTATRDNNDVSVYTRKSNGMSIGCENNQGYVDMFLYQKTLDENENVGIQIETSQTPIIPIETREIMNRNKGIYQKEKVQDEIEEHTEEGCEPENVRDFDGDEDTLTHEHMSEDVLNDYVMEIFNYKNENGEEKIREVFTESEVKDKLTRELEENKDKISIEQIIENVKEEMNQDAEILDREHKL